MCSSGSTLNLLQYFGISAKLPRTASRPRKTPPFGSVSGDSHSTLSAKYFPTPSKSPLLKASYAPRTTSTFSTDMAPPCCVCEARAYFNRFVRGGLHTGIERIGRCRRRCCFARDPSVSAAPSSRSLGNVMKEAPFGGTISCHRRPSQEGGLVHHVACWVGSQSQACRCLPDL